jgi:hypothetical protein
VLAQSLTVGADTGFDVPLAYSASGGSLVVTHWTGASFQSPGDAVMQILTPGGGRASYEQFTRFFGWSTR